MLPLGATATLLGVHTGYTSSPPNARLMPSGQDCRLAGPIAIRVTYPVPVVFAAFADDCQRAVPAFGGQGVDVSVQCQVGDRELRSRKRRDSSS
jgi:hypothetical protein